MSRPVVHTVTWYRHHASFHSELYKLVTSWHTGLVFIQTCSLGSLRREESLDSFRFLLFHLGSTSPACRDAGRSRSAITRSVSILQVERKVVIVVFLSLRYHIGSLCLIVKVVRCDERGPTPRARPLMQTFARLIPRLKACFQDRIVIDDFDQPSSWSRRD